MNDIVPIEAHEEPELTSLGNGEELPEVGEWFWVDFTDQYSGGLDRIEKPVDDLVCTLPCLVRGGCLRCPWVGAAGRPGGSDVNSVVHGTSGGHALAAHAAQLGERVELPAHRSLYWLIGCGRRLGDPTGTSGSRPHLVRAEVFSTLRDRLLHVLTTLLFRSFPAEGLSFRGGPNFRPFFLGAELGSNGDLQGQKAATGLAGEQPFLRALFTN